MNYTNSEHVNIVRKSDFLQPILYFIRAGRKKPVAFDTLYAQSPGGIVLSLYETPDWRVPIDCSIIGGGLSKYHAFYQVRELFKFNYLFLLDADIELPDFSEARLLKKLGTRKINCAQLSLCKESHSAFGFLKQEYGRDFRRVNFVEVMAPIFSGASIDSVLNIFPRSISTWGLDFAWSRIFSGNRMYVIDSEKMTHRSKPDLSGGEFYKYIRSLNKDPFEEMSALKEEFACNDLWIGNIPPLVDGYLYGKLRAKLARLIRPLMP